MISGFSNVTRARARVRACGGAAHIILQTQKKITYKEVHGALGHSEIRAVSGNSVLI